MKNFAPLIINLVNGPDWRYQPEMLRKDSIMLYLVILKVSTKSDLFGRRDEFCDNVHDLQMVMTTDEN